MPPLLSRSPRKDRQKANHYIAARPRPNSRSKRITRAASKDYDARADESVREYRLKFERLGYITGDKTPSSYEEFLGQTDKRIFHDVNIDFDDDDFGGFEDEEMDYDHESEWEIDSTISDKELEDDEVKNNLKDKKSSDYIKRKQKEVDNWTELIAIITEDSVMQGKSPFCACNKSTLSISTVSLSADILHYSMSLMMQDMSK